jgi:hypothetical protein
MLMSEVDRVPSAEATWLPGRFATAKFNDLAVQWLSLQSHKEILGLHISRVSPPSQILQYPVETESWRTIWA